MKKILMTCAALTAGICFAIPPLDANNDGKISLEEYVANRSASSENQGKKIKRSVLVEAFKRTDTNNDGFLSVEEREVAKKK